jgi:hypothetical protein
MFLLKNSCPATQSELNLFSNAPTATDVESGYHTQHQPTSGVNDASMRFHFHTDQQDYVDFLHSYLVFTLKVTQDNGNTLEEDCKVSCVNNIAQSLFSQVDLFLNGVLVTHSSSTAHYRAYLENLLSYSCDTKQSQLTLNGWYKDTAGQFDTLDENNSGFTKRSELIALSKPFQVVSRLHTDISLQGKYILNGVDVELRLIRNSDAFCLMAAADSKFKLKITEASFFVRKVKLSSGTQLKHIRLMEKDNGHALYPFSRTEIRSYVIPMGSLSSIEENLFTGQLPRRIIFGLVASEAYEGRYNRNPFNFQHFDMTFACLYKTAFRFRLNRIHQILQTTAIAENI